MNYHPCRMPTPVRVLVVDDSAVCRAAIRGILETDPLIHVVGEAADGLEATQMIEALRPDLVTLDLAMPRMGGLDTIEWVMRHCPTRILVITERPEVDGVDMAFASLSRGALELLPKLTWYEPDSPESKLLLDRVKALARKEPGRASPVKRTAQPRRSRRSGIAAIGIGASTGGPTALAELLKALPSDLPVPVLVVQHMHPLFEESFVLWLKSRSKLPVKLAQDGEELPKGQVRVAPQGMDLIARGSRIELVPPVPGVLHVPSVDRLFDSLAATFADRAAGVLLSGMGVDGASGMRALYEKGGLTLAQDRDSAVIYGMPGAALEAGAVEHVLPLEGIASMLADAAKGSAQSSSEVRGKVLLVDDSPLVLESVRHTLESAGYQVVALQNPLQVPSAVRRERPDLVLIDVNMPAVQGDIVAKIVRDHGLAKSIQVLLFSDQPSSELALKAERCGADGFIEKRAGESALLSRVREALGR